MDTIKVVDARMGRGKSTAAIHYINANKRTKRFLYATPFLSEVERIRNCCGLEEPDDNDGQSSKTNDLRSLLYQGKSIATTHSLYELMADDMLDVIREKRYTLIIDETISPIEKADITSKDREILDSITTVNDGGFISWLDPEYTGKFDGYKEMADRGVLCKVDQTVISIFNYNLLTAFEDVFLLTYLFKGSVLDAYFQCFGIQSEIWGIALEDGSPGSEIFVPGPDQPPPIDYGGLIHIVDKKSMNEIGDPYHALAKNWYRQRSYHDDDVIRLRKNMQNFFKNITKSSRDNRIWTCFTDYKQYLIPDNGSYAGNFLQMMARATNKLAECSNVAYMVNRFEDPNVMKFLTNHGCTVDRDQCALSDMLQWIWRSSIRNGKEINLYIPSRRMRELLISWINQTAEGGVPGAQLS